jgi:tripartite-type tricarboxylate transporter receptor subunit TctC
MLKSVSALVMGLATLLVTTSVSGQSFPTQQLSIVVTFPPGGNADTVARLIAENMAQALKQPVIIENKPGAATIPGTSAVLQAPADGHTLLQSGTNTNINTLLGYKTPYDAERDLAPVALLVRVPAILVVNADVPANTVADLVALAKAKPGQLNYGSAGNGTFAHLAMEQFNQATGTQITHVPFRGLGPSMIGLLRNDVQIMTSDIPGSIEHIRAGKLRALAHTGATRMPQLPDLPTLAEVGVAGYEAAGFLGIMVRTGTPPDAIQILNRQINLALKSPELTRHIANNGLGLGGGTPTDFIEFLKRDRATWAKVIAEGKIKAQ